MANVTFHVQEKISPNGVKKYVCKLNLEGRTTSRFGGYTEKDANNKGIQLCAEYIKDPGAFFDKIEKDGTITEMVEAFLNRPIADKTNDLYRTHLVEVLETYKPRSPEAFNQNFLMHLKKDMKNAGLSDGYISIRIRVLRTFVRYCLDEKYIKIDPWPTKTAQGMKGAPVVPTYRSKGHFYTDAELLSLFTLSPNPSELELDLNRAMRIAYAQGWREEPVWEFCWERIDIYHGVYKLEGMKGALDKEVPLMPETLKVIKELGGPTTEDGKQKSGRIFTRWGAPDALGLAFRRFRDGAPNIDPKATIKYPHRKFPRGRFHDLKHTCVSKMMMSGKFHLKEISELTNTSVAALQHYVHADKQTLATKLKQYDPMPKSDRQLSGGLEIIKPPIDLEGVA